MPIKRRVPDHARLHTRIQVRLSPGELAKLRAKARSLGLTPSAVLRELVRRLQP